MHALTRALCAASLLTITAGAAQAATVNLGNLFETSHIIGQSYSKGTVFSDDYLFDLTPAASYTSVVTTVNLDPYFSISGLTISLSGNGMTPVTKTLSAGETALKIDPIVLSAGNGYVFNVSGTATGNLGGSYAGVLAAAAPVPVPAAAWLLGSGLIGMAGFARKRQVA